MREALTPILGETGAVIAQYLITFAIILGLIVAIVWAVRRYAQATVGQTARGRMPRLAVVDALAVDGRRRLVLVRRDNIEHLLLIGGPSDIVVEPGIVRTRVGQRPGQPATSRGSAQAPVAPQPAPPPPPERAGPPPAGRVAAVRAPRTPPSTVDDPIPFPPRRPASRLVAREPGERPEPVPAPGPAAAPEPERPAATERPVPRHMPAPPAITPRPEAPVATPEPPERESMTAPMRMAVGHDSPFAPPEKPAQPAPPAAREDEEDRRIAAAAAALRPVAETEEPERPPPGTPHRNDREPIDVSDLEEDMARLLGQISPRR